MKTHNKLHKVSLSVLVALGLASSSLALAQEEDIDDLLEEEEIEETSERISVTGSRIRKQEFSSASPIQVIDGDISRELGLFDASELLQTTSQVSGIQIDNTFGGFVLDNGPGASTIGFRGLGAGRTLVLINGRRVAPAGVGGAPVSPDLNLIPAVMIDRIENLFDGASTVYGSDAIAGVANAILRTDVDGFEVQANYSDPESGGGEESTVSVMYGANGDNYNFSIAGEFYERRGQSYAESAFASDCNLVWFENPEGEILSEYRGIGPVAEPLSGCDIFPLTNRIVEENFFGSLYFDPTGYTNIGVPGLVETTTSLGNIPFIAGTVAADSNGDGVDDIAIYDGNGDGFMDINFQNPFYSIGQTDYINSADWVSPLKRFSLFLNGDYLFNDENDTRFFYEALYSKRESDVFSPGAQIFQWVPVDNPYNPCGTDPINGQNCFAGTGLDQFFGDLRSRMLPIINIRGDRDDNIVDVYQYRVVAGIDGNLGVLQDFGAGNWIYELSANYSYSKGVNTIEGVGEANLVNSLENSVRGADGTISCGPGCVPVNLFANNIYQLGGGRFTPEEEAYLMVTRSIETEIKQSVLMGYISGDLTTLPWNDEVVPLVIGAEFRKDEIITNANDVAAQGLLWGYFADQGAEGSRNIREVFFETEFPLLKGAKFAEELTVTAAGRWTDESFYAPERVWSLKGVYRPTDWLTVRGTRGTSYRAPNLRERFLSGTSGFGNISDPCVVPTIARDSDLTAGPNAPEIYLPDDDPRDERVFTSCANNGLDATSLGLRTATTAAAFPQTNIEITTGGTEDLNPETSISETYGFVIEQPFSDQFELTFSLTNYKIEIFNSVAEPSAQFLINNCYDNADIPDGSSGFCRAIVRGTDGLIDGVNASFINIGFEGSEGTDYNIFYQQDFVVGERELGVTLDVIATKLKSQAFDILGNSDDNVGEPTFPEWRGSARLSVSYSDFRFNWFTRFIGAGERDDLDEFEFQENGIACDGIADTCRPVAYTTDYTVHSASVNYQWDNYSVTFGVQNVFNDEPPKVDDGGVFSTRNIPLGVGYDLFGRSAYLSFGATF